MSAELLLAITKGAVLGGVVGWATNKLAVWMLFNPKRPATIGGFAVPLTPGLVVKNQQRLAAAVGQSVARDLLDPETIARELGDIGLAARVARELGSLRREWEKSEAPISRLLGPEATESVSAAVGATAAREAAGAWRILAAPSSPVESACLSLATEWLSKPLAEIAGPAGMARLEAFAVDAIGRTLNSAPVQQAIGELVRHAVKELPASSAFAEVERAAGELIASRIPALVSGFQDALASYLTGEELAQTLRPQLAKRLHGAILERFPMARMFVSEEILSDLLGQRWGSIMGELAAAARGEAVGRFLGGQLEAGPGQLVGGLRQALESEESSDRLVAWLTQKASDAAGAFGGSDALRERVASVVRELGDRSVVDLAPEAPRWIQQQLAAGSERFAEWLESPEGQKRTGEVVADMVKRAADAATAGDLIRRVPEGTWAQLELAVAQAIERRAVALAPHLLREDLKLDELVTRRIEDFEAHKLEATINRVSGRELTGIIRLGGLLGVVVGVATELVFFFLR